jgi:peptidoglycan/LPS O-acetylase OafA/YrhL
MLYRRLLQALIPPSLKSSSNNKSTKHGITALDGLRGLACLFVFNEHYVICYQSRNSQHWINRLPFIRLWWHGKGAVYLFFVISGYVLSYKPLKQIRQQDYEGFNKTMSSSIVRRGFRLYLPCLVASFIIMILTSLGVYDTPKKIVEQYSPFLFIKEWPPENTDWSQMWAVYWSNVKFIFCATFPFNINTDEYGYAKYDDHQWSIPVEFRGSMALFTVLVGISRMRTAVRLCCELAVFYYLYDTGRVHVSLFFGGLLTAELDLLRHAYSSRPPSPISHPSASGPLSHDLQSTINTIPRHIHSLIHNTSPETTTTIWLLLFFLGYFMVSSVREIQSAGNWLPQKLDGQVADPDVFLLTYGSILAVWAVANSSALGVVFNHPVVQYLGRLSYALYLVHGTTIRSIGYIWLPVSLRIATGTFPPAELDKEWWDGVSNAEATVAHLLGLAVVGTATLWYADVFMRQVDVPVVRFARWVDSVLTMGGGDGIGSGDGGLGAVKS